MKYLGDNPKELKEVVYREDLEKYLEFIMDEVLEIKDMDAYSRGRDSAYITMMLKFWNTFAV